MMAMVQEKETRVHSGYEANLEVEREDISFQDVDGDRVRISVTVHNRGLERSRPAGMRLESAPLGAFVAWKPLTRMIVPALDPGESRQLSTEVLRPRPVPLGDFNGVPPRKLLEALSTPDQPSDPAPKVSAMVNLLRSRLRTRAAIWAAAGGPSLAPDPMDLLGRSQPHWAGNINVFIGNHAVERHMARALKIYPGRSNHAMFLVGLGSAVATAYSFELAGLASGWKAALHDATPSPGLLSGSGSQLINERTWIKSVCGLIVRFAVNPPAGCQAGNVQVRVTRKSDNQTAIVEFDLDPAAQGPGCYTV